MWSIKNIIIKVWADNSISYCTYDLRFAQAKEIPITQSMGAFADVALNKTAGDKY